MLRCICKGNLGDASEIETLGDGLVNRACKGWHPTGKMLAQFPERPCKIKFERLPSDASVRGAHDAGHLGKIW